MLFLKAQTFLVGKGKHTKTWRLTCFYQFKLMNILFGVLRKNYSLLPVSFGVFCSSAKQNYGLESNYVLHVVREKILNSLNALEDKAYSGDIILQSAKKPLSLSAVARGPKLRLLWAAFQQVEEEAGIVFIFFNIVICIYYVILV